MQPVVLLNVVGLTARHIGEHTPHLRALAGRGHLTPMGGVLPAVTLPAQASLLTGVLPDRHGIVGNGWFHRDTGEVRFWLQSNRLMQCEPLYQQARRLAGERRQPFTCAQLFWWFNQGALVDYSLTPKPYYGADGSKVFAIDGSPDPLAPALEKSLGPFPFHNFWGPLAGWPSSEWIGRAAAEVIGQQHLTLTLVYLPHLDYDLQRFGPQHAGLAANLRDADRAAGWVLDAAQAAGAAVVVVSEYGLVPVRRPVYLNRTLRQAAWLTVRDGPFGETLEAFRSRALAVADHQVAHIYVRDPVDVPAVRRLLEKVDGVADLLEGSARSAAGLSHERAGDLVALAAEDAWFAYPYWLDDRRAPDFARTVDIHRKPGYDPCELFFDPQMAVPKLRAGLKLLRKAAGMRYLMDLIPLDATLVKGSHGLSPKDPLDGPVLITDGPPPDRPFHMTQVKDYVLRLLDGH